MNDIIKRNEFVNNNEWGQLRGEILPTKYEITSIAGIDKELCDRKVTIYLKRILRQQSPLQYKVTLKCIAIKKYIKV